MKHIVRDKNGNDVFTVNGYARCLLWVEYPEFSDKELYMRPADIVVLSFSVGGKSEAKRFIDEYDKELHGE